MKYPIASEGLRPQTPASEIYYIVWAPPLWNLFLRPCILCLHSEIFVEMRKHLLSNDTATNLFFKWRISQDPLENYFGQLRMRGAETNNLQQCFHNASAIRVQKLMAITDPVCDNCSQKRQLWDDNHQPKITDMHFPKQKKSKNM